MYTRYHDERTGDLYEIYLNDQTGQFIHAQRSIDMIGATPIYYGSMKEIPQLQRNAIEQHIAAQWSKSHK